MKKVITGFFAMAFMQLTWAQQERNVGDFNTLKVYDRIPVELVSSSKNKVEVYGAGEGDVETVNKNGQLKIRMTTTKILQGDDTHVKVYYRDLNEIQASQGARISSGDTVKSEMLQLTSNEGSDINLNINASRLNVKANSGGELHITGNADSQDIVASSGAKFYGKSVKSDNVTVAVNAGGEAYVNARKSVKATTRAGGRIEVYGDPDDRNVKKIAGGNILFK
ncbi:head GIN domain-containing protein [Weeksellaceae bacterium A-14]